MWERERIKFLHSLLESTAVNDDEERERALESMFKQDVNFFQNIFPSYTKTNFVDIFNAYDTRPNKLSIKNLLLQFNELFVNFKHDNKFIPIDLYFKRFFLDTWSLVREEILLIFCTCPDIATISFLQYDQDILTDVLLVL